MKIWVFGAQGMVGSLVVKQAQKKGIPVVGSGKQDVDICSIEQLRLAAFQIEPTHIINCAAYTDVDGAEKNVDLAFAVNAQGAENCARIALEMGAHLLHISTDYVFSGGKTPYLETDECNPINVYGRSKREGELRVLRENPFSCIVRTSWVFGRRSKNLISSLLTRFCSEKQLYVVDDQIGKPTYCADLVEALLNLQGEKGIIHYANEGASSRYQIALSLLELAKQCQLSVEGIAKPQFGAKASFAIPSVICESIIPVKTSDFPTLAPRPLYSVLDTSKYTGMISKPRHWLEAAKEFLRDE